VIPSSPVPREDSGNNSPQQVQLTQLGQHLNRGDQEGLCPPPPVAPPAVQPVHLLNKICGKNVILNREKRRAVRFRDFSHGLVLGAAPLSAGELFEVEITLVSSVWTGSLSIGLTTLSVQESRHINLPETISGIEADTWFITGKDMTPLLSH